MGFLDSLTGKKEKKKAPPKKKPKSKLKIKRVGGTAKSIVSSIRKARRGG